MLIVQWKAVNVNHVDYVDLQAISPKQYSAETQVMIKFLLGKASLSENMPKKPEMVIMLIPLWTCW